MVEEKISVGLEGPGVVIVVVHCQVAEVKVQEAGAVFADTVVAGVGVGVDQGAGVPAGLVGLVLATSNRKQRDLIS